MPQVEQQQPADLQCAICFETIDQATKLPCACKASYCTRCWDMSLAHSFNVCHRAQCPSCRSVVRVDFHAEDLSLSFSKDTEDSDEHPAEPANVRRSRLLEQARPAQVRILEQYGGVRPFLRLADEPDPETFEERVAEAALDPPQCVCGSSLIYVSYEERLRRCLLLRWPSVQSGTPQFENLLNNVLQSNDPCFYCDLCGEYWRSGRVWTCENGNNTILHTNAYDVCEICFARYACGRVTAAPVSECI